MKLAEYNGNRNIVSRLVREARIRHNMSQTELAAKLQVLGVAMDQQMVSRIESNTRIVKDFELIALSVILKLDLSTLLQDFCDSCSGF